MNDVNPDTAKYQGIGSVIKFQTMGELHGTDAETMLTNFSFHQSFCS